MVKNSRVFLCIFCFLLMAWACTKHNVQDLYPPDTSDCDTSNLTYSGSIKTIINNSCASTIACHKGAAQTGIDLSTYEGLLTIVNNGKILPAIKHTGPKPMPEGAPKLDDCTILKIET